MNVTEFGILAKGKKELVKHQKGERLTRGQAIIAHCYDCMGGYTDGRYDCGIPECPLHPYMPYKNQKESAGDTENCYNEQ